MADLYGVAYGAALVLGGLLGYFRRQSYMSLISGLIFGVWSIYNSTHRSRQNNVANLAIAALLGVVMLVRFLNSFKVFPAFVVVVLSAIQVYRNYPYLK